MYLTGVAAASSTIAPDDGTVHLGLAAETNNPPSCTVGCKGTQAILRSPVSAARTGSCSATPPKKDPNKLDLNPIANQLAPLLGVTPN